MFDLYKCCADVPLNISKRASHNGVTIVATSMRKKCPCIAIRKPYSLTLKHSVLGSYTTFYMRGIQCHHLLTVSQLMRALNS